MTIHEPAQRDLAIFRAVHLEGASIATIAETLEMTSTNVLEVVQQVQAWYQATASQWADDGGASPLVALRLHQERLDYLYSEAVAAWHQSKQPVAITRQTSLGTTTTTAPSFGKTRYLVAAARIAVALVDASVRTAKLVKKLNTPPERVCTAEAPVADVPAPQGKNLVDASHNVKSLCDVPLVAGESPAAPKNEIFTPVHPAQRKRRLAHSA